MDAFRGIIIGLMILVNNPGTWAHIYPPFKHAEWHGCTLTDLVFPFFIFIIGISISLAYNTSSSSNYSFNRKVIIRSFLLYLLGWFLMAYTLTFPFIKEISRWRIPGVLQRISIVFLISSLLYRYLKLKTLYIIFGLILILYWLLMTGIPLFDGSLPTLERGSNIASDIDLWLLKSNHLWKKNYDPEGLVSTIPAIASCLYGIFLGQILLSKDKPPTYKMTLFSIIGLTSIIIGYIWHYSFPFNKALWSSSFVLYTGGWAYLSFSLFYYLFDIRKISVLKKPLVSLGSNALIIFFLSGFIAKFFYIYKLSDGKSLHYTMYQKIKIIYPNNDLTSLVYALIVLSFYILLSSYLYKHKIFIKV